ncbi:MAG: hypothetical protein R3F65_03890 [bacterium]
MGERGAAAVGRPAGEHVVEDGAERVDVGVGSHGGAVAAGLLGGHVGGGADDAAADGGAGRDVVGERGVALGAAVEAGDAPVEHEDLAEDAEHDVGRLEVAVHDAMDVGVGDGAGDAAEGVDEAAEGRGVGFAGEVVVHHLVERAAADAAHGEPGAAVGELAAVVYGDDAGVLQAGVDAGFFEEAGAGAGVAEAVGAHDLEREGAVEVVVVDLADDAHAAEADDAEVFVAVGVELAGGVAADGGAAAAGVFAGAGAGVAGAGVAGAGVAGAGVAGAGVAGAGVAGAQQVAVEGRRGDGGRSGGGPAARGSRRGWSGDGRGGAGVAGGAIVTVGSCEGAGFLLGGAKALSPLSPSSSIMLISMPWDCSRRQSAGVRYSARRWPHCAARPKIGGSSRAPTRRWAGLRAATWSSSRSTCRVPMRWCAGRARAGSFGIYTAAMGRGSMEGSSSRARRSS